MYKSSEQDYHEILAVGESTLTSLNTRITRSAQKKLNLIWAQLQSENPLCKLPKQSVIEWIINEQFARMSEQPKSKGLAEEWARAHREGKKI